MCVIYKNVVATMLNKMKVFYTMFYVLELDGIMTCICVTQ